MVIVLKVKISTTHNRFPTPVLCLSDNPSTSEKHNDSENENLRQQTIHETYPSVIKQLLNN